MRLSTWIERNPRACFGVFALLHAVLWTILPYLLYPNLPLDLIEALTYGREWQLGYDKLPPLPWWLAELVYRLGGADFALYFLAQLCILAAFALVWATALPLVGPLGALASVLIIDGLHYFNFTAPKFNHDVMQLPFWALAGFSFHAALRTGRLLHWAKSRRRVRIGGVGEVFCRRACGAARTIFCSSILVRARRWRRLGLTSL